MLWFQSYFRTVTGKSGVISALEVAVDELFKRLKQIIEDIYISVASTVSSLQLDLKKS